MRHSIHLRCAELELASLLPEHVTPQYVGWLNDPETNRHTEQAHRSHDIKSVRDYVEANLATDHVLLWRILHAGGHVGNIRLSGFAPPHKRGTIALLLGEGRGQGIGTTAIDLVSSYALSDLGLHKVCAGIYSTNPASRRAFEKAGFHLEATFQSHAFHDNQFIDVWQMAKFA